MTAECDLLGNLLYALERLALLLDPLSHLVSDFWFISSKSARVTFSLPVINLSISIFSSTLPTIVMASKSAVVRGNIIPDVMLQSAVKKSTECLYPERVSSQATMN
jgi:hypothetical protein